VDAVMNLMTVGSFFMLLIALFLLAGIFCVYMMRIPKGRRVKVLSGSLFFILIVLILLSAGFIYGLLSVSFSYLAFRIFVLTLLGILVGLSCWALISDVEHIAHMHTHHKFKWGAEISQAIFFSLLFVVILLLGLTLFSDNFFLNLTMMIFVWILAFYLYSLYPKFFIHLEEEYGKIFIVHKAKKRAANGKKRK